MTTTPPDGGAAGPSDRAAARKPRRYSRKLAEEICRRIADGETWLTISETDDMRYATLYAWRDQRPEFRAGLARALEIAADHKAERALQVAEASTAATVQADRLRIATLMQHAALAAPHRWGRRAEQDAGAAEEAVEIYARRFEKLTRADGSTVVREVLPQEQP
jgi:hypothetical protein